jgi:hypothetical protein
MGANFFVVISYFMSDLHFPAKETAVCPLLCNVCRMLEIFSVNEVEGKQRIDV